MIKITTYLSSPHILLSVTIPAAVSLAWLVGAIHRQNVSASLIKSWMLCVIGTYFCSRWEVTEDLRQLFIIPVFFFYLAFHLYFGEKISPATAFSLAFLANWSVDMTRALELAIAKEVAFDEFYYGVGGAGMGDGLVFVPLAAVFLVYYVDFRRQSNPAYRMRAA